VLEIHTVLCAVDGSDISRRAFNWGAALARLSGARLSVLQVVDWSPPPLIRSGSTLAGLPLKLQTETLDALNELVAPARAAGVATEISLEAGDVVRAILRRADVLSADAIVVGTHGRSGVGRLALGSVAEKILRQAACPVLTVPPAAGMPPPSLHTILCATDFSEPSTAALRMARSLAQPMNSRFLLVHAVELPFGGAGGPSSTTDLRLQLETEASELLERAIDETASLGGVVKPVVATGVAAREILAVAREQGADLIVMGVSGRGAVERAVLGSTATSVIREAACPVLTVRAPGPRKEARHEEEGGRRAIP
jgi:nucleotide-binding universal stress UspA family protein